MEITATIFDLIPAGTLVGLVVLILKNNKDYDAKVGRVYKRLDEVKEETDKKYRSKETCEILHKQTALDIKEIKTDVKSLLNKIGNN